MKVGKIKFFGEIYSYSQRSGRSFSDQFDELIANGADKIVISMHCYGGEVFEGNVIYNTIANSPVPVEIQIVGVAASMGSVVMLPAKERTIAENGFIMIHTPSGGVRGNAKKMRSAAELLEKMQHNFQKNYVAATGKTAATFEKLMDGNDHWFTAQEALELGLVTKIIPRVAKVKDLDKEAISALGERGMYAHFAAHFNKQQQQSNNNQMDIKAMAKALGLPETATEDEVVAAMQSQKRDLEALQTEKANAEKDGKRKERAKALGLPETATDDEILAESKRQSAELNQLKAEKEQREKAEKEKQETEDNAMIDAAVQKGLIDASSVESWKAMFKANREQALKVFPAKRESIVGQISDSGDKAFVPGSEFDKRFEEIRKGK